VNIIADKSLLAAFAAATRSVTMQHLRAAIRDCDFAAGWSAPDPRSRTRPVAWLVVSALAAGLALGAGAVWLAAAKPPAPAAAAPSVAAQEPTSNGVAAPALPPVAASQPAPGSLAAVAGNSLPAVVASPAATPQPTAPEAAAARTNAESQPLAERLRASQDWLATRAAQNFAIQLMVAGASQPDLVARHIRAGEAVLGTSLHAYPMALSGGSMVGVVYGDFADRSAAQAALARLPPELAAAKPYVRTFQAIRGDAR